MLLAWLGHELQDAVEIASAPEVINSRTMEDLYRARGQVEPNEMCTREAQKVREIVAYELAVSGKARR